MMKPILRKLIFYYLCLAYCGVARSQVYPIRVNVQLIPPYSAFIDDYKTKPVISFTNQSQSPMDVYLRGNLQNDRGQYIQTKPNVFTNVPIHVPGLQTIVVQGNQIDGNYLDINNLQTNLNNQAYSNLFQFGMIPEGFYSFCIYAYTRNTNGNYIPVSDPQAAGSCFAYNVGYVVPPVILSPMPDASITATPNQNINMTWTRPVGNMQGAALVYDLYMVKVVPDEDPNLSLNNAIQYGAGIFLKQSNLQINNFKFTNLSTFQLDLGSRYAVMVQARDLNGKTVFENNGRSQVSAFTYGSVAGAPVLTGVAGPVQNVLSGNFSCSCKTDISSFDKSNNNQSLKNGGSFTMASLPIKIATLNPPSGPTVSGTGTVLFNNVPIDITFQDIIVNKDGIAIAGTTTGAMSNGFNFLNNGGTPSVSTDNYNSFLDQIKNYNIDAVKNGAGLPLPFGLKQIGMPDAVNLGVIGLTITPQQAAYDAIAVVQLADANNVLSLLAKNVCFSNTSPMCGDALFLLAQDFQVPAINLNFKSYSSNTDPGTFVLLSGGSIKQFHIKAEYSFPSSQLTKADGSTEKAVLDADAPNWSDWTASVTMDPFKLGSLDGVLFTLNSGAMYDHSTLRNPAGMPASFSDPDLSEKNAEIGNPLWTGFYIPSITVSLPSIVKSISASSPNLTIAATNLVLDKDGITGIVSANNVLSLDNGSLGGWYCSVDQINIKLLNSAYKTGGLSGKLILPFSDRTNTQSQITYSCTLSSSGTGTGLTYQFVAQQANDIDFSAWWAHIDLSNCSILVTNNNATNSTVASADLSGKLSLEGNIEGFKVGIDLVDVEHLVIQTQAPYVTVQNATAGFASPQHFLSGFPISITNIHPVITGSQAGLQFDFGLNLSDISNDLLPSATTTLTVKANILSGGRPLWQKTDIELDSVKVSGGLAGIVTIKEGYLAFFHDDPTFGDGIQGFLDASFSGLNAMEVTSNVKFGNSPYNYWYFDAFLKFNPAIVVGPGISINGFGGGAYYNMMRTANNDAVEKADYFKNLNQYQVNAFKPQKGSFGFKAKVGICSSDGYIFSGFGEIGMTFSTAGSFSVSSIDGSVYALLMTSLPTGSDDPNSPIQGIINWHIGIADKVYDINGAMSVSFPSDGSVMNGNGWFDLMADVGNQNYYIKMGEPDPSKRINVTVMNLFNFSAYFMAGNQINAAIPDPDPDLVDVSQLSGYQKLDYNPDAGGLVFGAEFKFNHEFDYLIFYLNIKAGLGFDISLAHYKQGCNGSINPPGINGWYGLGQVYAGLNGEFGVQVDLWFYSGRVKALDVDASLLLRGGLPNPNWFDGYAMFNYNVLDGAVSGSINFHVAFGDKCVPEQQVFSLPLIQELKPSDQSTNVPINAVTQVLFNYPAEKQFDLVITDDNGDQQVHSYKLVIENCTVTNQATGQLYASYTDHNSYPVFEDQDNKTLDMSPDDAFQAQTQYAFSVTVKAQELTNGQWNDSYYKGAIVEQNQSAGFKTGDCNPDALISDPRSRLGAYPFPNQRYFLQGESKQGAIILDKNYGCVSDPSEKFSLVARFTAVKNHSAVGSFEKPTNSGSGHFLKFDIPTLPNDCVVRVEIIKRKKLSAQDNYTLFKSNLPVITSLNKSQSANPDSRTTISYAGYNGMMQSNNSLPQNKGLSVSAQQMAVTAQYSSFNQNHNLKLADKSVDIVLYSYHFRTSHFNSLSDKMKHISYSQVTGYQGLGNSPNISLSATEKFESYDITGFVSGNYNSSYVYFSLPLTVFKENPNYNSWLRNYALPCVYQSFYNAGINVDDARNNAGTSYQEFQQLGLACTSDIYCVPLRPIEIISYDQPLSADDIDADETPDQILAAQGKFVASTQIVNSNIKNYKK
jgi:hypothetical protein